MDKNPQESAPSMSAKRFNERRDNYGRGLSITEDSSVNTNWKAIIWALTGAIGVTIMATIWCVKLSATVDGHTAQLIDLKVDFREMNSKVNALLIDRGINPQQVVKEAAAASPPTPSRP